MILLKVKRGKTTLKMLMNSLKVKEDLVDVKVLKDIEDADVMDVVLYSDL